MDGNDTKNIQENFTSGNKVNTLKNSDNKIGTNRINERNGESQPNISASTNSTHKSLRSGASIKKTKTNSLSGLSKICR